VFRIDPISIVFNIIGNKKSKEWITISWYFCSRLFSLVLQHIEPNFPLNNSNFSMFESKSRYQILNIFKKSVFIKIWIIMEDLWLALKTRFVAI